LTGQIKAFKGFLAESDPSVRHEQKMVVEAHGHCYQTAYPAAFPGLLLGLQLGREMFANAHNEGIEDEKDRLIVPSHPIVERADALSFFVMGPIGQTGPTVVGNYYTTLPNWPTFQPSSYYLTNGGVLQQQQQPQQATVAYSFNPADPAEHYGGHNLGGTCGGLPQNEIESRADVLSFTTAAFIQDTAFVGPIQVVLYVSSDRNDTDFIVKINDVHPETNQSHLLSEGAIRMRLRESRYYYTPMQAQQIYEVVIDVWETSFVFNRGHRMRLTVMSGSYDRWGLNYNNFGTLETQPDRDMVVARNTIHFGGNFPSRVIMPFVTFDQIPEVDFSF